LAAVLIPPPPPLLLLPVSVGFGVVVTVVAEPLMVVV